MFFFKKGFDEIFSLLSLENKFIFENLYCSFYFSVHSSDSTRLDLIIPAEQHFYLRASTPHERQQWLIALGTSKACLTDGRSLPETGVPSLMQFHTCFVFFII